MSTATSRGIDVSSYQGTQDWAKHKREGVAFAFAKASEGERSRDSRFDSHIAAIKKAGLVAGAYHFAWPNQDAAREAANYIGAVKPYAENGFLHWLDLERYSDGRNYKGRSAAQIKAWVSTWVTAVQKAFPGQKVGIYTSADDLAAGHVPTGLPLWFPRYPWGEASYARAEAATRPNPSSRTPVTIWQFTSSPIDRSIAYMAPAALRAWAQGSTSYVPPAFPAGLAPGKSTPSAVPLQRALKAAGFMAASVPESAMYGPQTRAAVIAFHNTHTQFRAKGVSSDPAIGPRGWAHLFTLAYGKATS
ncbi:N-acetylmuramoyl-L-alanine amidase [Streptomyces sp. V2]|uniref:GH25 family lysozyme n=1 Tax=Streptomyces sp. V2 TaxID=1424099 RepID=UPI000D66DF62|nr:GH25 family lysozyme [Streptomyces sp. V2]PWG08788.1 N-acetylmuramoyl-L-alanine amidase [Streptomyces sp. V2]